MAADQAPRRTRRYIFGGLLAAGAVAIGLALIFTVGGVGKKEAKDSAAPVVSSLDDKQPGISDVLKDLVTPKDEPTTVTPVAPAAPATPAKPAGGEEKVFTQVKKLPRLAWPGLYMPPFDQMADSHPHPNQPYDTTRHDTAHRTTPTPLPPR